MSIPCVGDCDANGFVVVDEVLKGVGIALGDGREVGGCRPLDANNDGQITVAELLTAVNNASNDCSTSPLD